MKKDILEQLVNDGCSTTEIGKKINLSQTCTRYWLKKYGLKTKPYYSLDNRLKISNEQLLESWKNADSINQFCKNLGVCNSGGAWYHYKKRLTILGVVLDASILNGRKRGGLKRAKKSNELAVKQRVRLPRQVLKKSMDLANILYECNRCKLFEWKNKPLKLHIHHTDHDKTNNIISNLEYICPNCHNIEHYSIA